MRKNYILVALLLALAGCASEPAPTVPAQYVMKDEDKAVTSIMDVHLEPGQVLVRCAANHCYDVFTGDTIPLDTPPNGYMLISALDEDGEM